MEDIGNLSVRQLNYLTEKYLEDGQLQADKDLTVALVRRNPEIVQYASDSLKKDVDVALACVKSNGRALRFLHSEMQENEEVVLCAVENFCASFAFAGGEARKSKRVALAIARRGGDTIGMLSEELLDDEEIARAAVERNPKALKYFSERIRSLEDIVLTAVNKDRTAIIFASDSAFKSRRVFEKAVGTLNGKIRITALTNATPLGVFEQIEKRGLKFAFAGQSIDLLTLDRDKALLCLSCGEGAVVNKAELLRKYVLLQDVEIVTLLLEKCKFSHKAILAEIKFASENRRIRVLPMLLKATHGAGAKEVDAKTERTYLLRSLRRKSPTAITRFKENLSKYINDEELVTSVAVADGSILKNLVGTDYLKKEDFVTACLKSYVVKLSDGALLNGIKINLTEEQALLACKRDGRNYYYLDERFKQIKKIAAAAVSSSEEVYDILSEELKQDADIIREKRLWIR